MFLALHFGATSCVHVINALKQLHLFLFTVESAANELTLKEICSLTRLQKCSSSNSFNGAGRLLDRFDSSLHDDLVSNFKRRGAMMLIVGLQSSFACFLAQNASETNY